MGENKLIIYYLTITVYHTQLVYEAIPVLVAILQEKGCKHTHFGTKVTTLKRESIESL